MSARTRFLAGPVRGRTHRSAPTRGSIREPTEICAGNGPCPNGAGQSPPPTGGPGVDRRRGAPGGRRGEVTPPYGCNAGSAQQRADVGIGPYEKERATSTTRASGAQRSVCAADGRDGWESRQRSPQKGPSTPDNPSVSLRLTAPFTQGSLGDGGCGLPRRFAPRNDSPDPLSFRGGPTGRRGNPPFLR